MFEFMDEDIDFLSFDEKYRGAKAYFRRAEQFVEDGQCHSVVFNVAAVALEYYLVALCELYGVQPLNHNYTCLMDAVQEAVAVPDRLNRQIRDMDTLFRICSLEDFEISAPGIEDRDRVLVLCREVELLFDRERISRLEGFHGRGN